MEFVGVNLSLFVVHHCLDFEFPALIDMPFVIIDVYVGLVNAFFLRTFDLEFHVGSFSVVQTETGL